LLVRLEASGEVGGVNIPSLTVVVVLVELKVQVRSVGRGAGVADVTDALAGVDDVADLKVGANGVQVQVTRGESATFMGDLHPESGFGVANTVDKNHHAIAGGVDGGSDVSGEVNTTVSKATFPGTVPGAVSAKALSAGEVSNASGNGTHPAAAACSALQGLHGVGVVGELLEAKSAGGCERGLGIAGPGGHAQSKTGEVLHHGGGALRSLRAETLREGGAGQALSRRGRGPGENGDAADDSDDG